MIRERLNFIRLSELPDLVEACAAFHANITRDPNATEDDISDGYDMRLAAFRKLALDGEQEDAIIAYRTEEDMAGERVLGMIVGLAALVQTDLDAFDDLTPWVTGIAIEPDDADDDLALTLVVKTEEMARDYGYSELFLATAEPDFFQAAGYQKIEPFDKNGSDYWVLGKAL